MSQRLDAFTAAPEGYRAVFGVEQYVRANVDPTILHLVKLRASIVNGCAFCVDMHSRDAQADGEALQRLFAVAAWREAPFFTPHERAALALTDDVTILERHGVSDDVWEQAAKLFSDKEMADLLLAIGTINLWNRLAIPTRTEPALATD